MSTAVAAADEAPKKKSKLPIIIAAAIFAAAAAGGGVWFYMKQHASHEQVEEPKKKAPVFLPLDNFTVNLADRTHYLQAGLVFEVETPEIAETMKSFMPVIRSRILMLLSSKTEEDLISAEGKDKLSQELIEAVREPLAEKERKAVEKVHFSAFVIQ